MQEISENHKKTNFIFNLSKRQDFNDFYYKAMNFIHNLELFYFCQFEEKNNIYQLTLCNLWRIEKHENFILKFYEFSLAQKKWLPVESPDNSWVEMPLYIVKNSTKWIKKLVEKIGTWIFSFLGFDKLTESEENTDTYVMSKESFEYVFLKQLYSKYFNSINIGKNLFLKKFYKYFYKKEICSALKTINFYKPITLVEYLKAIQNSQGLLKVAQEHRNLLPLLTRINPKYWQRDDLFSRKLWVKDGRKSTALDRFESFEDNRILKSFDAPIVWRWLLKASPNTIRKITPYNKNLVTNIALANINFKAPVMAYTVLFDAGLSDFEVSEQIQRVIRLFLATATSIWQQEGFTFVRRWLRYDGGRDLDSIVDFLRNGAFNNGHPNKNATWNSLKRLADEWHLERMRIYEEQRAREEKKAKINRKWKSLIDELTIDDVLFKALTSTKDLNNEGKEMHHCVSTYSDDCFKGNFRIFSVTEKNGERSTLSIRFAGNQAILDQHYSHCNNFVSEKRAKLGKKFVKIYQKKLDKNKRIKK